MSSVRVCELVKGLCGGRVVFRSFSCGAPVVPFLEVVQGRVRGREGCNVAVWCFGGVVFDVYWGVDGVHFGDFVGRFFLCDPLFFEKIGGVL